MINIVLPVVVLVTLNVLIYQAMSRSKKSCENGPKLRRSTENTLRKREMRITNASIVIVIIFVICHSPRFLPNVIELFLKQQEFPKVLTFSVKHNVPGFRSTEEK